MMRDSRSRVSQEGLSPVDRMRAAISFGLLIALICLVPVPSSAPAEAFLRTVPNGRLADPGDEYWSTEFGQQGVDNLVSALTFGLDGSLYAGGSFTTAGETPVSRVARWDGNQWHPLGSGVDGNVQAVAFGPDGSLYAGGAFTVAGGVTANSIARWDGSQWHPLGSGMAGDFPSVHALAFGPDGSLYAGGVFTTAGGVVANGIARWDGSQWHSLGGGMWGSLFESPRVYAIAFGPNSSLFAGGVFTTAGGVETKSIARWDGSQWHPLGSGMGGSVFAIPAVNALAFGPDGSLYAGGYFTTAGGVVTNGIARWDGFQWHPLDSGMGGGDGSNFTSVLALAILQDGLLYAGGYFTAAGGIPASRIAGWDGSQWYPLGSGVELFPQWRPYVYALALGPDRSLFVGGRFLTAGGEPSRFIARWTGAVNPLVPPVVWLPMIAITH